VDQDVAEIKPSMTVFGACSDYGATVVPGAPDLVQQL
jgi:hypothetical protein